MNNKKPKRQRIEDALKRLETKSKYRYSFYFSNGFDNNKVHYINELKDALYRHNIKYDDSFMGLDFEMELSYLIAKGDELYFDITYPIYARQVKYSVFDDCYIVYLDAERTNLIK